MLIGILEQAGPPADDHVLLQRILLAVEHVVEPAADALPDRVEVQTCVTEPMRTMTLGWMRTT